MDEPIDYNDLDIENLNKFHIPSSFLRKLHEFSGPCDGSRGFIVAMISESGDPVIVSQYDNKIIEMGIRKTLEVYLEDSFNDDIIYE